MRNAGETAPVGVFDSGLGGLSVLRHVRRLLPRESLVYVADSRHAPYGERDAAWVERRCIELGGFFQARGVKALVVACNTATAVSVARLRERLAMPVIGIEPAIKPAVAASRKGVVGVMTTRATAASSRFRALCARFSDRARILVRACPGLVECVERGEFDGPAVRALLEEHLAPLCAAGMDALVLGCTHYPFLAGAIRAVAGEGVAIIEPGEAVARQLARRLREADALRPGGEGDVRFYSSAPARMAAASRLWEGGMRWEALD